MPEYGRSIKDTTYIKPSLRSLSENSVVGPRASHFFSLAKPVPSNAEGTEAGDIGFIVDAAPDVHRDSQAKKGPLEARSSSSTGSHVQ